jgi:hypothetical protein
MRSPFSKTILNGAIDVARIEGIDRAAQRGARLQPVTLESQSAMNEPDGPTTEPRIRINRPDDENARYKVSRAYGPAARTRRARGIQRVRPVSLPALFV